MAWCCTEGERAYVGTEAVVDSLAEELSALAGHEVYVTLRARMGDIPPISDATDTTG